VSEILWLFDKVYHEVVMGHVDNFAVAKTHLQLANSPTPWVDMFVMVMF
jgi:hypothetical protein